VSPKWSLLSVTHSGSVLINKALIFPFPSIKYESQATFPKHGLAGCVKSEDQAIQTLVNHKATWLTPILRNLCLEPLYHSTLPSLFFFFFFFFFMKLGEEAAALILEQSNHQAPGALLGRSWLSSPWSGPRSLRISLPSSLWLSPKDIFRNKNWLLDKERKISKVLAWFSPY
jgi:hypothetical protein